MKKLILKGITITLLCVAFASNSAWGDQFTLNLVNGTVIKVEADANQTIPWNTVNSAGKMTKQPCRLGDMQRINLTEQPASLKIAKVRELLDKLDSDSYPIRQEAQTALSQPELGIPFRDLIELEKENSSLEVRARVHEILLALKKNKSSKPPEFDILYLKDGTVRRGDVGELVFKCEFRGAELTFKRTAIRRLSPQTIRVAQPPARGTVAPETLHKHKDEFYETPERVIDFESVEVQDTKASKDLTTTFIDRGVIMNADGAGFVGLANYAFQYPDTPTGGESACVVDASGTYRKRFEGKMEFTFCVPGLPDIPAGVHEFGLFLSRAENPRDFILEAYNQDSQLLATTEATDEFCVFLGVRSNEPIAFVRVLSNPYLFELDRKVDKNYAIDNIWFGPPTPLHDATIARIIPGSHTISLKNGEILSVEDLRIDDDSLKVFDSLLGKQFVIETDDIRAIRFATDKEFESALRLPDPTSDDWMVMLKDRSILKVTPGKSFTSQLLNQRQFAPEELMAIWSQRDQMRFPEKGDFDNAQNVLVFPTCRWQTEIELNESGVSWKPGKKVVQPVYPRLMREEAVEKKKNPPAREDATPKFTKFQFGERTESQMPTIWFAEPQLFPDEQGYVALKDGQQLVLGGEQGFSISELNQNGITISDPKQLSIEIPTEQIRSIRFPK